MALGSIERRVRSDGKPSYRLRWDTVGADGKRRQRSRTYLTKKAAEDARIKLQHELRAGTYVEPSLEPLAAYLARWLAAVTPGRRASTIRTYDAMIRRQIVPTLGAVPVGKLTASQVQGWLAILLARGLAPATVAKALIVLRQALTQAVRWGEVAINVAAAVEPPRIPETERTIWTAAQTAAFLDGLAGDELAALWRLAATTGLRRGELIALRWADIDLDGGLLHVRRTQTRDRERRLAFGPPKTSGSRRMAALSAETVAALRDHRDAQRFRRRRAGADWVDGDLVFDRGSGQLIEPAMLNYRFDILVARLGLPRIRLHDLRHIASSLMGAAGVPAKVAMERLGHKRLSMTMLYTHTETRQHADAADAVERLLASARAHDVPTASTDAAEKPAN